MSVIQEAKKYLTAKKVELARKWILDAREEEKKVTTPNLDWKRQEELAGLNALPQQREESNRKLILSEVDARIKGIRDQMQAWVKAEVALHQARLTEQFRKELEARHPFKDLSHKIEFTPDEDAN